MQNESIEDIPQPASDSYSAGGRVQIYTGSDDPDSRYHGVVCVIVDVLTDGLGTETRRATDGYSYILQDVETDEELLISFRHQDLVPVKSAQ
ncbi:uncharacterized protein OE_6113F (plasmid) [Halobacterium salinarum R1]|uniref:DUF8139 domain-containing protein n=2 Tax=Halobacterium salinarum NRC-34001 TaxID=2886895 RepID=A0A510NBE8_HALSA|nr:uncharacterized protein OE_6113F [Halobacterium salinarum R1]DAC80000.1 TPA_inf: uncharacterized protein VNG_6427c [Halobacterium salinarum NRC-1]